MQGRKIGGHKLVIGKRGNRKWSDEKKAETALSLILPPDMMYEPRSIVSPTRAEKAVDKALFKPLRSLVVQSAGSPALVPESDPREEWKPLTFVEPRNELPNDKAFEGVVGAPDAQLSLFRI
jgi:hypothetical protein